MLSYRTNLRWMIGVALLATCLAGLQTVLANDNPALGIGEPTTPPCPSASSPCGCPPDPNCCEKPPCCKKPPCDCKGSGSPVSARFGAMRLPFTDLEYTIGDIGFKIERSYGSDEFYVGYLGRGATSTLDQMSISTFNGGTNHELVVVRTPQGQRFEYLRQPDSSYTGPVGHYDRLTKAGGLFVLTNQDGMIFTFDEETGLLVSRADKNGHTVSFTYQPDGRPATIELFSGWSITITYGVNGFVQSITDFAGRTVSYDYDTDGHLTEFVDAEGHLWTYTYNPQGLLSGIVSPLGDTILSVTYDGEDRVSRMIDKDGDYSYTYASGSTTKKNNALTAILGSNVNQILYYDSQGVITRITEPNNSNSYFNYDANYVVTRQTDRDGTSTDFLYDALGRVTRETYADGAFKTYTYHPTLDLKTSETNERNVTTLWEYDANGNVTREVRASGTPRQEETTWAYDAAGRVTRQTDAAGLVSTMSYDTLGQLTQRAEPGPVTLTFAYDSLGNLTRASDHTGNAVLYQYDNLLRRTRVTDPVGNVSTMDYDPAGRVTSRIDSVRGTLTYGYDALGQLTRATNGEGASEYSYYTGPYLVREADDLGRQVLYAYSSIGEITSATRQTADGNRTTTYARDTLGRETGMTGQNGLTESTTYDNRGRIKTRTKSGLTETFNYDPAGNVTQKTDFWGNSYVKSYDELDRVTTDGDGAGNWLTMVRDVAGRLAQRLLPRGTQTYSYDTVGRLTRVLDADGHPTDYQYDALGRTTQTLIDGTPKLTRELDSLGRTTTATRAGGRGTSWTYSGYSYPASVTEVGGRVTNYEYDGAYQLTRLVLPDGTNFHYEYDAGQRLTKRTLPSTQEIVAEYDGWDQLKRLNYPDLTTRTFSYNDFYQITSVTSPSGTISFGYDTQGRVTSQTYNGRTITYGYSANMKTFTTTYPGGMVVTRQLDTRLRLASVTVSGDPGPAASYTYAVDNVLNTITYGSGVQATFAFNGESFLTGLTYDKTGSTVRGWQRGIDGMGNTAYVSRTDAPAQSYQVLRDAEDRVTGKRVGTLDENHTVPVPTRSESFSLDGLGNWLSYALDGATQTRTHDLNNRITQIDGGSPVTLLYDANGSLTDDGTYLYAWDYDGLLTDVRLKTDNTLVESYGYDPLGRLVRVVSGAQTIEFVRDLDDHVIETYVDGAFAAGHVYGAKLDEHVCSNIGGTRYYYVTDASQNVAALTNAAGTVVESYEYDTYGAPRFFDAGGGSIPGSAIGNSFLFLGRDYRAATSLYYFRARFLSPMLGRFLSPDAMAERVDYYAENLYVYADSSPFDKSDPYGLCVEGCVSTKIGGGPPAIKYGGLGKGSWAVKIEVKLQGEAKICRKCCKDGGCGYKATSEVSGSGSATATFDVTPPIGGLAWALFKAIWQKAGGQIGFFVDLTASLTDSMSSSYDSCTGERKSKICTELSASATGRGGMSTPEIGGCSASAWLYGTGSYKYTCCIVDGVGDGCKHCLSGKIGVKGDVGCKIDTFFGKVDVKDGFDVTIWKAESSGCK